MPIASIKPKIIGLGRIQFFLQGTFSALVSKASRPLVNPRFTQIESVLFSLFLGLESTTIEFDSFDFYRLIQVAIKNQSS